MDKKIKSLGPNIIQSRILKELRCEIPYLLTKMCKFSFKSAAMAEEWNVGNVTLIFKKRSRTVGQKETLHSEL